MQFKQSIIALASTLALGSAFAAPAPSSIAISSGASAVKGNFTAGLQALCSGVFTTFNSGTNYTTHVCANTAVIAGNTGTNNYVNKPAGEFIPFTGTAFSEVRLAVQNGSFTAVCLINGWPGGTCPAADVYVNPAVSPVALAAAPGGSIPVGGVLDVEPSAWPGTVLSGAGPTPAGASLGVAQAFGLAVSSSLYTKLFNAQLSTGNATVSKPLPSTCTSASDTAKLECIPTVSKAQMATIMAGDEFNAAGVNGVGFLTGDSSQNGQTLIYARRVDTSGTQAAAQVYFLGLPCMKNPLPIGAGGAIYGALDFRNLGSTGNVRTVLTGAGDAIGVMSGENNQSESWRWVRIGGAALGENAAPAGAGITNSATMLNGQYDFWFEATYAPSTQPGAAAFWTALSGSLNTLTAPIGLINAAQLSAQGNFKKSGLTCQLGVGN